MANSVIVLEQLLEELHFPIPRIQTDCGREFFAEKFQPQLMECSIKFRPIKPASPRLNGKVERVQKTVLDEFYTSVKLVSPDLEQKLDKWQHYYNWHRVYSSLDGNTPRCKLFPKTPPMRLLHFHGQGKKSYLSSKGGMNKWKKNKATGGTASRSKLMLSSWFYGATSQGDNGQQSS